MYNIGMLENILEAQKTDFIKGLYDTKSRTATAQIVERFPMGVGGYYGSEELKFFVLLRVLRAERFKDTRFAGKEFKELEEDEVKELIRVYDTVRRVGLPVPPTTRYFETKDCKPAILMTDMTEGGKYRLWGYNERSSSKECETFRSMELTKEEVIKIKESSQNVMELASKNNIYLRFHNYHVRQRIETRDLDEVLLDLDETNLEYRRGLNPNENKLELSVFFSELSRMIDQTKKTNF